MEKSDIKLSVIIPIYGVEKYIEKCARSLFEQTMSDGIEFIFVNDCTKDNSVEILTKTLESYPLRKSQVIIINHEQNKGLAGARQTGLNIAKGEYIIHCDSDDWIDTNLYEVMYREAVSDGADMIVAGFVYEYKGKSVVSHECVTDQIPRSYFNLLMNGDRFCAMWNKMVKKSLYLENDIHFTEGINMWEDVSVTIPLAFYARKISYVENVYYHYNQTNVNSYVTSMSRASLNNLMSVIDMLDSFLRRNNVFDEYSRALLNKKISVKLNLLVNTKGEEQKKFSSIYPETDKAILSFRAISPFWRIALICNSVMGINAFNIFLKISKLIKG